MSCVQIDTCADEFRSDRTFAAPRLQWWFVNPIIMMVWLGTAYAAGASALWPMVSFILPHHVLGTAYGTMTAIQNLGVWHCCDQWCLPCTAFDAECEVRAFLPSPSSCCFVRFLVARLLLIDCSTEVTRFARLLIGALHAGTSLAPQLIGYLQEKPGIKGTPLVYTIPIMLFVVCAATALALSLVLIVGMLRHPSGPVPASCTK
jgi:hypothetical protein